jgi:hypothetical protein
MEVPPKPEKEDPFKPVAQPPKPQAAPQKSPPPRKPATGKPPAIPPKGSKEDDGLPASDDFMSHIDEMFKLGN